MVNLAVKRHSSQEGRSLACCILIIDITLNPTTDDPDELRSIMLEEEARQLRNSLINEKKS